MEKLDNEILAYALKNAIEYGKADAGKILPKLFQHGLEKKDIGKIMPQIQESVKKVNSMKKDEKENEFLKYQKYVKEREEMERELPALPNTSGKMVFRLAPFPSGALHIGNAKTYLLNALYAEKYGARTIFVMDDTIGSEEKQIMPESYDLMKDAFDWLEVKYEKPIIYKSDRLEIYYEYAIKLIEKGKAYVCHCSQQELRKNRENGIECEHRNLEIKKQLDEWKKMFKAKEGSSVLRIKTSMQHPNPAFRDRVLFKISDRKHPRAGSKYRIWPTLEMSWAIDDHLLGITHILRGNDLMIETEMEKYIWDIFGWKHCETMHTGLIRIEGIEGAKISKSKAQKEVISGKFSGWDDPRTWSIQSLRRRGIQKNAIREFVEEIGLNKQDITVPIELLYSINRKMIDLNAERHYFVEAPVKLQVEKAPEINETEIPIHPDKKEKRKVKIRDVIISRGDLNNFKNREVRLLHLYNVKLPARGAKAVFTTMENKNIPKIQWVSSAVPVKIMMPNGSWIRGYAENSVRNLKEGAVIQFERVGFARFDKITNEGKNSNVYEFWFAHK